VAGREWVIHEVVRLLVFGVRTMWQLEELRFEVLLIVKQLFAANLFAEHQSEKRWIATPQYPQAETARFGQIVPDRLAPKPFLRWM